MRYIFLALFAVLCYSIAMNYEPDPVGYTPEQVRALDRFVAFQIKEEDRIDGYAKPVSPHKAMTQAERADAFNQLGWNSK